MRFSTLLLLVHDICYHVEFFFSYYLFDSLFDDNLFYTFFFLLPSRHHSLWSTHKQSFVISIQRSYIVPNFFRSITQHATLNNEDEFEMSFIIKLSPAGNHQAGSRWARAHFLMGVYIDFPLPTDHSTRLTDHASTNVSHKSSKQNALCSRFYRGFCDMHGDACFSATRSCKLRLVDK